MNRKVLLSLAALATAFAVVAAARAGSTNATFQAKARVNQSCIFATTTGSFAALDFATYDPLVAQASGGTDLSASTVLSVKCTKNAAGVTLALDGGKNVNNGVRNMANQTSGNTDVLAYSLTMPSATGTTASDSTTPWNPGDTFSIPSPTSSTQQIDVKVFGHLAAGQDVSDGDYLDTVKATVNY